MHALNEQIAGALAGAIFPLDSPGGRPRASDLGELVAAVSPLPALKFAEAHCVHAQAACIANQGRRPSSRHLPVGTWESLSSQLSERLPRFHSGTRQVLTLSSYAAVRGASSLEAQAACAKLERALGASPLTPFNVEWRFAPSQNGTHGLEQTLSLVANRTSIEGVLSRLLQRAGAQLAAGAYVHHYARYGCDQDSLREYMDECWRVVANYREVQALAIQQLPVGRSRGLP
jgi:hypothetical protein